MASRGRDQARVCPILKSDPSAGPPGKDGAGARKAKQNHMTKLVGSKTGDQVQGRPKQRKGPQTQIRQASPREPAVAGPRPRRLPRPVKRRQCDDRITYGGVRMRKHHNKWQRLNKWWDHLFNNKRDTESVAEGATELHLTIQRLIPAPRKRKGKRNLRVINLGT